MAGLSVPVGGNTPFPGTGTRGEPGATHDRQGSQMTAFADAGRHSSRSQVRGATRLLVAVLGCLLLAPAIASAAADPVQVNFTLQGCRLPAGETLPNVNGDFICADADYTTGNLGKNWNELDLVPHRLTTSTNTAQTYTVAV